MQAFLKAADVLSVKELEEALRVLQERVRASRALMRNSENETQANSGNEVSSSPDKAFSAISEDSSELPSNSANESPANSNNAGNEVPSISDNPSNESLVNLDNAFPLIPEVEKLFLTLNTDKKRKGIKNALSSFFIPNFAGGWYVKDPRLVDCQTSPPNYEQKLRRILSQRSMAMEYDFWERENFKTSRVDSISQDVAVAADPGHIAEFVESNFEIDDANTATHGIKHGIRLLVFERIYGVTGTSAIFMFIFTTFRSVKYESFPTLKHRLLEEEFWKEVVKHASSSLIQSQEQYDGKSHYLVIFPPALTSFQESIRMWKRHQACSGTDYPWRKRQRETSTISYYLSPQTPSTSHGRPTTSNIAQQYNSPTPATEPADTSNDFAPFQQPIPGPSNTHTSNSSWSLPQAGRTDSQNHALVFNASYEPVPRLDQPVWQQPPNYMGNHSTQTAMNGDGNHQLLSQFEPDTISACVYPQYTLPIDTMASSSFPHFLLESIGPDGYLEHTETPIDITVPSEFPLSTPETAMQHTTNNNRGTDTQSTFAHQGYTSIFNPIADGNAWCSDSVAV